MPPAEREGKTRYERERERMRVCTYVRKSNIGLSIEARLLDGIIAWGVKLQSHMQLVVRGFALPPPTTNAALPSTRGRQTDVMGTCTHV